ICRHYCVIFTIIACLSVYSKILRSRGINRIDQRINQSMKSKQWSTKDRRRNINEWVCRWILPCSHMDYPFRLFESIMGVVFGGWFVVFWRLARNNSYVCSGEEMD